ncbi:MAG: hypothetical protein D6753_18500 [Planctomycetota bacterium]|nr:MAG: hypothetical protein D6753_18500 [Planctomycetota bacterium]
MTMAAVAETQEQYPQYRAPQAPNTALIEPDLATVEQWAGQRYRFLDGGHLEFCGKSLDEARVQARHEIVDLALVHTRQYADPTITDAAVVDQRAIVLSGHQPELFHPGVWFKNYLLTRLVRNCGAIGINFLVDNDLCRETAIRVPSRRPDGSLQQAVVPFDAPRSAIPWELRRVESMDVWNSFPDRVAAALPSECSADFLTTLWPRCTAALQRTGNIGLALAEGRHRVELEEGLQTLEVPLSRMVSTRAFARFSIHLLADLPRFQDVYNSQREQYRQAHKIRNAAHPVPPLAQQSGWLEAPWWVYRPVDPERRPLWVRMVDDTLILSDRAGWQEQIEGRLDCDQAATQWLEFLADGICLRPRALLTTMYLRMFVGDVFIHGIGGGKYDQLTNGIMQEFFGIQPPPIVVASATIPLPQHAEWCPTSLAEIESQLRAAKQQLWELQQNPEKTLMRRIESGQTRLTESQRRRLQELAAEKRQLLQNIPPRGEKSQWHQRMSTIKRELQELAAVQADAVEQEIQRLESLAQQAAIAQSREYPFCIHPREYLVGQLKRLAQIDSA